MNAVFLTAQYARSKKTVPNVLSLLKMHYFPVSGALPLTLQNFRKLLFYSMDINTSIFFVSNVFRLYLWKDMDFLKC